MVQRLIGLGKSVGVGCGSAGEPTDPGSASTVDLLGWYW